MMPGTHRLLAARTRAACLVLLLGGLSCSPDLRGTAAEYQLLVFPGEAELGGSASAVIGSNYVPGADQVEDYRLVPSRVGVRIEDASGVEWDATVRNVLPMAASPTSRLAQTRPGAWVSVVLFDLPTDPSIDLGTGPPYQADVIVLIDGVPQLADEAIGSIVITGVDGTPTQVFLPGGGSSYQLEPILTRFRPVLDPDGQSGGFPQEPGGTVVGGLEADIVTFGPCYTNARAYAGSEAADAGVHLGPLEVLSGQGGGWYNTQRLVITDPEGFTLQPPSGGAPDALGEGPVIDIAFDRPNQSVIDCDLFTEPVVQLWNVYVVRPDGTTIADQRGTGTLGESSDLFELHFLPLSPGT